MQVAAVSKAPPATSPRTLVVVTGGHGVYASGDKISNKNYSSADTVLLHHHFLPWQESHPIEGQYAYAYMVKALH